MTLCVTLAGKESWGQKCLDSNQQSYKNVLYSINVAVFWKASIAKSCSHKKKSSQQLKKLNRTSQILVNINSWNDVPGQ